RARNSHATHPRSRLPGGSPFRAIHNPLAATATTSGTQNRAAWNDYGNTEPIRTTHHNLGYTIHLRDTIDDPPSVAARLAFSVLPLHDPEAYGNQFAAGTGARLREMDRIGHSTSRAALLCLNRSDDRQQAAGD